ncbi:MAG: IclR family transcriptional regulator [Bacillota bacterium]
MERSGVQVLDKALKLLEELAPRPGQEAWGVVELAQRTRVPVATAHRLLQVLKKHRFVAQMPDKRYRLGLRLMELGMTVWSSLDVRAVARPHMERLARELEESIYLTVRDGCEGVHVEKAESPLNLRITEPIGLRLPLYRGSSRLVILAFLDPSTVEEIMSRALQEGDLTVEGAESVRSRLQEIRAAGFAVTSGEVTRGTAGVALPIMGPGGEPVASLSAAGPDWRYPADRLPEIVRQLREAVRDVEETFGIGRPS